MRCINVYQNRREISICAIYITDLFMSFSISHSNTCYGFFLQMRDITCQNLTRLIGVCPDVNNVTIITEHCSRGNLQVKHMLKEFTVLFM